MAGSRALKEVTVCKSHSKSGMKKEMGSKKSSKQFMHTGPKASGPNYSQMHLGEGKPIGKL